MTRSETADSRASNSVLNQDKNKDAFTSLRRLTVDGDNNDNYVFAFDTDLGVGLHR